MPFLNPVLQGLLNGLLQTATNGILSNSQGISQGIFGFIASLVGLIKNTPPALTTENAVVMSSWTVMTGVADAFLGLLTVMTFVQLLYGRAAGSLYMPPGQFIPKLLLTAVLIHLSKFLGTELLLLNNALCNLVTDNIATFIRGVNGGQLLNTAQFAKTGVVLVIIDLVTGLLILRLVFQAFKRIVLFDLLFVLSGPAFLLSFHPLTAPWFSFWARLFVVTAFKQFFQFLGLSLSISLIINSNVTGVTGIFLATAMLTLVAEIPRLLDRFSGAQGADVGGVGSLARSAIAAAFLVTRFA